VISSKNGLLALLAIALLLGGYLRLHGLAAREMTPDEAESWQFASVASVRGVIELEPEYQGKLSIYYLFLRGWMRCLARGPRRSGCRESFSARPISF
jgi:hypothetical protein